MCKLPPWWWVWVENSEGAVEALLKPQPHLTNAGSPLPAVRHDVMDSRLLHCRTDAHATYTPKAVEYDDEASAALAYVHRASSWCRHARTSTSRVRWPRRAAPLNPRPHDALRGGRGWWRRRQGPAVAAGARQQAAAPGTCAAHSTHADHWHLCTAHVGTNRRAFQRAA